MQLKKKKGVRLFPGTRFSYFRKNMDKWSGLKAGKMVEVDTKKWQEMDGLTDSGLNEVLDRYLDVVKKVEQSIQEKPLEVKSGKKTVEQELTKFEKKVN